MGLMRWLAKRPCPQCGEEVEYEAWQDYGSFYQPPDSGVELAHDHACELTEEEWTALANAILTDGPDIAGGADA
jgi:hypothetical protein